jgi:hypothetical protein
MWWIKTIMQCNLVCGEGEKSGRNETFEQWEFEEWSGIYKLWISVVLCCVVLWLSWLWLYVMYLLVTTHMVPRCFFFSFFFFDGLVSQWYSKSSLFLVFVTNQVIFLFFVIFAPTNPNLSFCLQHQLNFFFWQKRNFIKINQKDLHTPFLCTEGSNILLTIIKSLYKTNKDP